MRIGIVTLPLHTNYGGILQAYALQKVLEDMGHKVEHLQPKVYFQKLHPDWKMPLVWCKRSYRRFVKNEKGLPIFIHPHKWIRKNTDKFIKKHINSRYIKSKDWSVLLSQEYDAVLFGSDQVWRPLYAIPIEKYFGSFLQGSSVKRISYAASFGTIDNEYSAEQQNTCSGLLKGFTAVSVREKSAVGMCKSMFGVDAEHVLDPTLLLLKEDYIKLFEQAATTKSVGNLAVYVLDESKATAEFVQRMAEKNGLVPFRTNSKVEDYDAPILERLQPPVEEWLRSFHDAELVITDSFHACVFSIIFRKPFICIGNKGRGSARFESLLSMFGLEDRLVDISDIDDVPLSPINWQYVEEILLQKKEAAIAFIKNSLDK